MKSLCLFIPKPNSIQWNRHSYRLGMHDDGSLVVLPEVRIVKGPCLAVSVCSHAVSVPVHGVLPCRGL